MSAITWGDYLRKGVINSIITKNQKFPDLYFVLQMKHNDQILKILYNIYLIYRKIIPEMQLYNLVHKATNTETAIFIVIAEY